MLLAVLPLLAFGCGPADGGGGKPENGLIASANENGIQLLEPDGSGARLVPGTEGATEPTWSPDGKWLAFTTTEAVGESLSSDLYVIRPDGTGRALVLRNGSGPSWSPDGKRIAVMRDSCLGREDQCLFEVDNPFDLYTVAVDGSDLRAVAADPDYEGDPSWSPGGEWIAFASADSLEVIRPNGTGRRAIVEGFPSSPAWLNERELAFELTKEDEDGIEIGIVDVETGEKRNVTKRPGHDLAPTRSPDGKQIAFLANSECLRTRGCTAHEEWEVWVMDSDGGNVRRLTAGGFGPPSWGPALTDDTS